MSTENTKFDFISQSEGKKRLCGFFSMFYVCFFAVGGHSFIFPAAFYPEEAKSCCGHYGRNGEKAAT